jgi:tetratricopeptide (TPR) repeat protein
MRVAYREATIAMGDAHLFARQIDKASQDYKTAEALDDPPIPAQVRATKSGAFPEAIEQRLDRNDADGAMRIVRRWQDEVPSDQIRGAALYYVGKIERLQGRPAGAIRPLQLSIELAQGAEFEAEARYLLAQAYGDIGDAEARTRTLNGLVKSGLSGPYREKAIEDLKAAATPAGGAK